MENQTKEAKLPRDESMTNWRYNQRKLTIPITIFDEESGKPKEIRMKVTMNTITFIGYGKTWTFSKSNRGTSVLDSRDNKRKPAPYILKELIRLIGEHEGNEAYEKLITV